MSAQHEFGSQHRLARYRSGRSRAALGSAVALAVSTLATPAFAAEEGVLEEIVVTAQFREEKLQDTPLAITAISDEMMRARGQDSIFEVTQQAPNVQIKKNLGPFGSSTSAFIRGVGQGDFNFALEPGVGMYIDDVYFPTMTGSAFEIVDLERVEVLRGPQGTLQGRNAIGGSVRLISRKPTGDGPGYAEATVGRFDRIGLKAAGEFALVPDQLFLRITGASNNQDGYVERRDFACDQPALAASLNIRSTGTGNADCHLGTLGGQSYTAGRAILRWIPSDAVEVNIIGDLTNDNSEAAALTLAAVSGTNTALGPGYGPWFVAGERYITYETFSDSSGGVTGQAYTTPPINHLRTWGAAGIVDIKLTDALAIKSISSWRGIENSFATAHDGSPFNGETGFNELKGHSFQQELRLNGTAGPVDYTLGVFYFTQKNQNRNRIDLGYTGTPFPFDFISKEVADSDSKAAFVHAVWHPTDAMSITGGLRYSDEQKDQTLGRLNPADGGRTASTIPPFAALLPTGYPPVVTFADERIDYRVSLDYRWSDAFMTYATHSTGFKNGGVSPRFFFASHIVPFAVEEMKAYEIGFKSDLLGNTMRVNFAYFLNDYKDIQAGAAGGVCPELTPSAPCLATRNQQDQEIRGAELEISYRPVPDFLVDASVSQIESKFTRLPRALLPATYNFGADVPFGIPEYKASLGIQYGFPFIGGGTLTPRFDVNYEAERDVADIRTLKTPSSTVLNARLTWRAESGDWETALGVTNLTDKYYWVNLFDIRTFAAAGAWAAAQPAPPREWALTIRRNFQ
jgi:iron complex outermembrane recepter protein